jgi:hypothetical protein
MANQRLEGTSFAFFIAIRQLVLQGFPTTTTRTSEAAFSGDRFALRGKDLSVDAQEILALHSRLAGHASHEQCPIHAAKTLVEIHRGNDFSQKGKRTVLEFHHNAFQRRERDRNFNEMEIDRLIRPDPAAMRGRSE